MDKLMGKHTTVRNGVCLFAAYLSLGLPQGTAVDAPALRSKASQAHLSAAEKNELVNGLRALIDSPEGTADQRCADALLSFRLLRSLDRDQAEQFAVRLSAQPWITTASPRLRSILAAEVAEQLAFSEHWKVAERLIAESRALAPGNPEVAAQAALFECNRGQAVGDRSRLFAAAEALTPLISHPGLPLRLRQEAAATQLQVHAGLGIRSEEQLARMARSAELLASKSNDESAFYLRLVVNSLELLPESGKAFNLRIQKWAARMQRKTPAEVESRARVELDVENIAKANTWDQLRVDAAARFGERSRSFLKSSLCLAAAILNVSRQDNPLDGAEGVTNEAGIMRVVKECLTALDRPKPDIWVPPAAITMMWIRYYHRTRQPEAMKRAYLQLGSDQAAARLVSLPLLLESEPKLVAHDWQQAMGVFAESIVGIARQNPDDALRFLSTWNYHWSAFEVLAQRHPAPFLEGYLQATGIVKNLPYGRREGKPGETGGRIYGPVTLQQVQAKLTPARPMVVYVRFLEPGKESGEAKYGAFLLSGLRPIKYVDLGTAEKIDGAVIDWGASMRVPGAESAPVGNPRTAGKRLYELLLQPVVGKKPPPGMIVVPDGQIGKTSFAAFISPSGKWLAEEVTLSYLGAMRDLLDESEPSKEPNVATYATNFFASSRLSPPKETIAALGRLGAVKTIPFSATRSGGLRRPRHLLISTHGKTIGTASTDPLEIARASYLIAPKPATDHKIFSDEVAGWNLKGTSLVLLAACFGGRSESLSAEGTGGLRRALYIAGARQVIASQRFTVGVGAGDAPGDRLLSLVCRSLASGARPEESLRRAQIQMLRDPKTAAPHVWGNFICEGAPR